MELTPCRYHASRIASRITGPGGIWIGTVFNPLGRGTDRDSERTDPSLIDSSHPCFVVLSEPLISPLSQPLDTALSLESDALVLTDLWHYRV